MSDLAVVWIGDATLAERYLARRASQIRISSAAGAGAAGLLEQASSSHPAPDILVIDTTASDCDPLEVVLLAKSHGLDLPLILITPLSGNEELILQIGRLAVCDCVVKTQDFVYQMPLAFAQVRARHDLHGVFRALRDSEEHLREVLEMQPAVVFTMDAETRVMAMNRAGLALLSTGREKVVGQPFTSFLSVDDQSGMMDLLARMSSGEGGEFEHSIAVANGDLRRVRTHVVPLTRDTGNVALATLVPVAQAGPSADLNSEVVRLNLAVAEAMAEAAVLRREGEAMESRWSASQRAAEEGHARALEHHDAERAQIVSSLETRVGELEAELNHARQSWERAESERAALADRESSFIDELAARERMLTDEFSRIQAVNDELVARELALKGELAAKEHVVGDVLREAESRLTSLTSTIGDLEALRDQLSRQLSDARTESSGLSAECARLSTELHAARQDAAAILSQRENDQNTLVEREERLAERERTLVEEFSSREQALRDGFTSTERALRDEIRARERDLAAALASRKETETDDGRRDLFELREMLLEILFEADQRYRTPRGERQVSPGDVDDTRRQSFLSFPLKDSSRSSSGSRGW
jgi:PAS domain S-box-containing protein